MPAVTVAALPSRAPVRNKAHTLHGSQVNIPFGRAARGTQGFLTISAKMVDPQLVAHFHSEGYGVIRGFANQQEVLNMKNRMAKLIEEWNMDESRGSIFSTDPNEKHISNDYFLGSSETVRFFFEPDAIDPKTSKIREDIPKERLINKVGHALHTLDPVFREYSFSQKVKDLVAALGYKDPVLPQSMYIFKQPGIGGVVTSHQDSTFLHTEPRQTCLGLWLALDGADIQNGCLWARPKSHTELLRRKFARTSEGGEDLVKFIQLHDDPKVTWEGALPKGPQGDGEATGKDSQTAAIEALQAAGFVSVEAAPGDLVFFMGTLDHLSLPNLSERPRHTYQLHLVEGPAEGVTWSASNWLQYGEGRAFPSLSKGI